MPLERLMITASPSMTLARTSSCRHRSRELGPTITALVACFGAGVDCAQGPAAVPRRLRPVGFSGDWIYAYVTSSAERRIDVTRRQWPTAPIDGEAGRHP